LLSLCQLWRKDGTRDIKMGVMGNATMDKAGVVKETSAILKIATCPSGAAETGIMDGTTAGWAGGGLLPAHGISILNRFTPIPILMYLLSW
jgi:hypothetical protein